MPTWVSPEEPARISDADGRPQRSWKAFYPTSYVPIPSPRYAKEPKSLGSNPEVSTAVLPTLARMQSGPTETCLSSLWNGAPPQP